MKQYVNAAGTLSILAVLSGSGLYLILSIVRSVIE